MNIVYFPLFKWAMGFIAGIVLAYQVPLSLSFSLGLAVISLLFFGVAYFFTTKNLGKRWFFDGTSLWLSVVLGMNVLTLHTESNDRLNYSRHVSVFEKPSWIAVVVQQKLKSNAFSDRYVASIRTINEQEQTGSIIININKNKLSKGIEVGTPLRFLSVLVKTSLSKNPYQFDYSIYLKNKQIYAQVYLDPEEIKYQFTPEKSIWYYAANTRKIIVAHLQESGFDFKALPVAMALILGQQQDIDPNITKDYQYAGAVHILSVSGLHIGSIVFFIHFLLRPIPNTKRGRFLKLVISLSMLLVFGVLAGLAASVVRSITMFSIIAIGQYLNRSTSIFHTLVVSMLLILLFQPYFLFDVGFQLSYAALFFIVWLQPMLQALWAPKNKIIRFFWNIMTVSLAAQLGTFPLSVFYFHQFPGLFFITNLLVLPLIGVIMFLGVVVMLVAVFGTVPVIVYKPLEYGILFMNAIIHKVASFENFIFTNIPFNSYLLVASFVLIFALVFWLKKITFKRTVMVLMAILVFQICFFVIRSEYEATQEWVVLNASKQTIICERIGNSIAVYTRQKYRKNISKNVTVQNYATGSFSRVSAIKPLGNVAFFNGNRILLLDSSVVKIPKLPVDILVLTQSPKINFERFLLDNRPQKVVADASNYKSLVRFWKKTCAKQKIPFHATSEKGYFLLK